MPTTPNRTAAREPFSAEAFLEFARSKPADEVYDFRDVQLCACGQFATSLGWDGDESSKFRDDIERVLGGYSYDGDWTFGSLARRLEKALADQVQP